MTNRRFRARRSPTLAALVISAVIHGGMAVGAVLWGRSIAQSGLPLDSVRDALPVKLEASWTAEPKPPEPDRPEVNSAPLGVTVLPDRTEIGRQTFFSRPSQVRHTKEEEAAIVERMLRLPPPAVPRSEGGTPSAAAEELVKTTLARATFPPAVVTEATSDGESPAVEAQGDALPRPLENPPPQYPPSAVAARQEGTVILRLQISAEGRVEHLEIVQSSGHLSLDAAAFNAVRMWTFEPAASSGRKVGSVSRMSVHFQL